MTNPELEAHLHGQAETVRVARVKPLEWRQHTAGVWRAETDLGDYRVWTYHEADGVWFWALSGVLKRGNGEGSEQECLDACQADFASRILSCIEPAATSEQQLREIISECASALGNGAVAAPSCSIEFLAKVPEEIRMVVSRLAASAPNREVK